MEGYGIMIENVIRDHLSRTAAEMKVAKENLRIIINPQGELLKIHLYHKGELIKKVTIEEIIGQ